MLSAFIPATFEKSARIRFHAEFAIRHKFQLTSSFLAVIDSDWNDIVYFRMVNVHPQEKRK